MLNYKRKSPVSAIINHHVSPLHLYLEQVRKIVSKMKVSARILYIIYFALTVLACISNIGPDFEKDESFAEIYRAN